MAWMQGVAVRSRTLEILRLADGVAVYDAERKQSKVNPVFGWRL